jgi:hypothetical protein
VPIRFFHFPPCITKLNLHFCNTRGENEYRQKAFRSRAKK